jgi:hypothetical protein
LNLASKNRDLNSKLRGQCLTQKSEKIWKVVHQPKRYTVYNYCTTRKKRKICDIKLGSSNIKQLHYYPKKTERPLMGEWFLLNKLSKYRYLHVFIVFCDKSRLKTS